MTRKVSRILLVQAFKEPPRFISPLEILLSGLSPEKLFAVDNYSDKYAIQQALKWLEEPAKTDVILGQESSAKLLDLQPLLTYMLKYPSQVYLSTDSQDPLIRKLSHTVGTTWTDNLEELAQTMLNASESR